MARHTGSRRRDRGSSAAQCRQASRSGCVNPRGRRPAARAQPDGAVRRQPRPTGARSPPRWTSLRAAPQRQPRCRLLGKNLLPPRPPAQTVCVLPHAGVGPSARRAANTRCRRQRLTGSASPRPEQVRSIEHPPASVADPCRHARERTRSARCPTRPAAPAGDRQPWLHDGRRRRATQQVPSHPQRVRTGH